MSLASAAVILLVLIFPATAQPTVKIGVAGPQSGPGASIGAAMHNGAYLAAAMINAAGGISGRKIELVVYDDVGDPKYAAAVANKAAADRIGFMIGHASTSTSIAAAPGYADAGILRIEPRGAFTRQGNPPGWNVLRICGSDDRKAVVLAAYLQKQLRPKAVGLVYDQGYYADAISSQFASALAAAKIDVAARERATTAREFVWAIDRIQSRGATAVVLTASDLNRLSQDGFGSSNSRMQFFLDEPDPASIGPQFRTIGAFVIDEIDHTVGRKLPTEFAKIKSEGIEAANTALFAFASVQVIAHGISQGKSEDAKRVSEQIRNGQKILTILGDLSFSASGDAGVPRFAIYGVGVGRNRTEVACDKGCGCSDGGCSEDCCSKK